MACCTHHVLGLQIGVSDTLSDSFQCLDFAKKWFIQYSIQYCFTQDSIQNIIQFKKNSADSIQKITQFNSQGIIDTGCTGKVPKNCPKSVQNRHTKKGGFSSKMANIDSKYDSFIHFTIQFNFKDYSISIFSGIFTSKNYSINVFPRKFNSKIYSKIWIWLYSIQKKYSFN